MKLLPITIFIFIQFISYSQEKSVQGIDDQGLDYSTPHYHKKYLLDKSDETIRLIAFYGDSIIEHSPKVYKRNNSQWIFDNHYGYKEIGKFEKYKISIFKRQIIVKACGKRYVLMKKVGKWQYFNNDIIFKEEQE